MSETAISLLFGAGVALAVALCMNLLARLPREDRAWHDQPPPVFRVLWLPIRLVAIWTGRWLSMPRRQSIERRLQQAGVEFRLSAEQFLAGRLLSIPLALLMTSPLLLDASLPALACVVLAVGAGAAYPGVWLRECTRRRQQDVAEALPFMLDIITLSVEAGNNLTGGIAQAVQRAPEGALRTELLRVLRDVRAGRTRADALRDLAERIGGHPVQSVVASLLQAERSGSSLVPILREQARQLRLARFRRAEKQALEAPVKLLGPLVLCIFPNTFLVLGFLVLSKAMQEQLITWWPLVWAYHWPG